MKGTLGFIGGGQMAEALIKGVIGAGVYKSGQIMVAEPQPERRAYLADAYQIRICEQSTPLLAECDVVILAVKPQVLPSVLEQHSKQIAKRHLLVSIAAGISIASMRALLSPDVRVIRVMPNVPALVQSAASVISPCPVSSKADLALAKEIFSALGSAVVLDEKFMDAVTGLSGSGPAYVYLFLEAMIDAGVMLGLSREVASLLARQTILGSMKLAEASPEKNAAELKAMVTSPGGTSIAAVKVMEQAGFRGIVMSAVEASAARSRELSEKQG